jgi:hypothetical protein
MTNHNQGGFGSPFFAQRNHNLGLNYIGRRVPSILMAGICWQSLTLLVELDRKARILGNVTKKTADSCGFEGDLSQVSPKCHTLCDKKNGGFLPFLYIYLQM